MKPITAFLIGVASTSCLAQPPVTLSAPAPAFEVASVRLSGPDSTNSSGPRFQTSRGSLSTRGLPLRYCIVLAYQMQPAQIDGPGWLNDVRLDIAAKAAAPIDDQQLYLMLRTLLAERLSLKAHIEQKEMPVYALTLAKGGPKFSASTTEGAISVTQGPRGLTIQHVSMFELATELSGKLFDRPLINSTGLQGRYDIRIDSAGVEGPNGDRMDAMSTMMRALQDQLGLKVEARKDMVDVLVIDHADKVPTDN
jgi:uncharacterized protein (TIGR03435 family)